MNATPDFELDRLVSFDTEVLIAEVRRVAEIVRDEFHATRRYASLRFCWRDNMEYRVASSWFCYSAGHKARKIETYLNDMAKDGWRFVALDAVSVFGFDIGYYLVVAREVRT